MAYESPITLIRTHTTEAVKEIQMRTDEVIFKAVVNVLPQVDKDELIKALAYDRGQYSKGYHDRDSEIVRCKDCRWWNEDDFPRAFPEKKTSACECPNIYGANFSRYTQEDEFCSRGVRKGGDENET